MGKKKIEVPVRITDPIVRGVLAKPKHLPHASAKDIAWLVELVAHRLVNDKEFKKFFYLERPNVRD